MKKLSVLVFITMMMFYNTCIAASTNDVIGGVIIDNSTTWYQEISADKTGILESITVYFSTLSSQNITASIWDINDDPLDPLSEPLTSLSEPLSIGQDSITFYWDKRLDFIDGQEFVFSITGDGEDMFTMLLLTGNIYDGNFYNSDGTSTLFDMKRDMYIIPNYTNPVPLTSSIGFFGLGLIGLVMFKRKKEE